MAVSLANKVVLITGASSGIGRALCHALAREGAKLALTGRSEARLQAVADGLRNADVAVLPAELTKPAEVEPLVTETLKRFGRIDALLANAGLYIPGEVAEGDPDAWDQLLSVNVNSVFRLIRAALPHMIKQQSGDIIVTSSISGHQAIPWEPIYSASKHAVQAFVHGLRQQVAKHNLRVGSVAPGMVLNELWGITDAKDIEARVAARSGLRNEDVAEAVLFMLTRPPNVTIRDLVMLPQSQGL